MNPNHLFTMTDSTGIIQHAKYSVPDLATGYTTDDNARALIVACWLYSNTKDKKYLSLIYTYFSFLYYGLNDKGKWKNFMSYDRNFLEKVGSEDCFGRAFWALGYAHFCKNILPQGIVDLNTEMIKSSFDNVKKIKHVRSLSYVLIGLTYMKDLYIEDMNDMISQTANRIVLSFSENKSDGWLWFEDIITYGNGIVPYSLFRAYEVTSNNEFLEVGIRVLQFIESIVLKSDILKLIGCNGWYPKNGDISEFDEQPVDALDMILAYSKLYRLTKNEYYLRKAKLCYSWFDGNNCLKVPLVDNTTGGAYDGLTAYGVNKNEGAESLIAYMLSTLIIKSLF